VAHQNRRATTLKLVKQIFDGRHRRRRVNVHSIQELFHFAARFPFEKQESNHRPILLFLHFSKIREHVRFHTQSKRNYESYSAEISTVALYENVLHDCKFLLRTYRTALVIVAARCNLHCLAIGLLIEDTHLDQVAVSIIGESETLQTVGSYILPNGLYKLYKAHLENITDIYNNLQDHQHIFVIGDFNLLSLFTAKQHTSTTRDSFHR